MGQPGNILINHLGFNINWHSIFSIFSKTYLTSIKLLNFKNLFLFLFKLSTVFIHHLFYSLIFFNKFLILTIPGNITSKTFFKFYRIDIISNVIAGIKKSYISRVGFFKTSFSNIFFLSLNNWIIVYFFYFLPAKDYNLLKLSNFTFFSLVFNFFLIIFLYFYNFFYFFYTFNLL